MYVENSINDDRANCDTVFFLYFKDINRGVNGLYVREAQFTDTGLYTCEARSPLHVDSKSAFLTVAGKYLYFYLVQITLLSQIRLLTKP